MATFSVNVTVQIALGANLTAAPGTWTWTDITAYVRFADGVTITRGRSDEFSTAAPARASLTLINDGRFVTRNPTGAYYGTIARNTPLRVLINGTVRFTGFVDQWPVRWNDQKQAVSIVTVTASGMLRRLAQGGALRSALYQAIVNTSQVVAYWPCEDMVGATSIATAVTGGKPMAIASPVTFAADSSMAGSGPLPTVTNTTSFSGPVTDYTAVSSGEFAVWWAIRVPSAPARAVALLQWTTSGTLPIWQLVLTPSGGTDTIALQAYNAAGSEQFSDPGSAFTGEPYGTQLWIEVRGKTSGGNVTWSWSVFSPASTTAISSGSGTKSVATLGLVTSVGFGSGHGTDALGGSTIGHIAVVADADLTIGQNGADGYSGEASYTRAQRLGGEQHVPLATIPTTPTTTWSTMGAPSISTLLSQLREIETAEEGVLFDGFDSTVNLILREARYTPTVALALDVRSGQVGWPFEPADDDQRLRNDCTVSRTGGGSYRYLDTTSVNSVTAVGYYSESITKNVATDDVLPYHAAWRAHLGTVDDMRYPQIILNLARSPSITTSWLACDIGSRIQISHPPSTLPPDILDLIIEGWTERIDTRSWTVALATSSVNPWRALALNGAGNIGRLESGAVNGSGTSTLHTGVNASATTLSVDVNSGPLWTTGATSIDISVAGEQMTVTNISGSSSPQTFTVTRSVNTVTKAQTSGTTIRLWRGTVLAL